MVAGQGRAGRPSQNARQEPRWSVLGGAPGPPPLDYLLKLELLELGPPWIPAAVVFVVGRIRVVQRLTTGRAEPGTVWPTEKLSGNREDGGIVGPAAEIELLVVHVGAAQLLVVGV